MTTTHTMIANAMRTTPPRELARALRDTMREFERTASPADHKAYIEEYFSDASADDLKSLAETISEAASTPTMTDALTAARQLLRDLRPTPTTRGIPMHEATDTPSNSLYERAVKLMERDKTGTMSFAQASSLASKMMRADNRVRRMGQDTDVGHGRGNRDFLEDNEHTQQRPHGESRLDQNSLFAAIKKRLGMHEHASHEDMLEHLEKICRRAGL